MKIDFDVRRIQTLSLKVGPNHTKMEILTQIKVVKNSLQGLYCVPAYTSLVSQLWHCLYFSLDSVWLGQVGQVLIL